MKTVAIHFKPAKATDISTNPDENAHLLYHLFDERYADGHDIGGIIMHNRGRRFYEIVSFHKGMFTLRDMRDNEIFEMYDTDLYDTHSVVYLPDADIEIPDAPEKKKEVFEAGDVVWVLPKGNNPTTYVKRVVLTCKNGMVLTLTEAIYSRFHSAIKKKHPLPDGISFYLYRVEDCLSINPNK